MIKSADIINFQSHKKTHLEFHKGVNAIVGPSDVGKSSILRALYWLMFNKPAGDSFRSRWGGETNVIVTLDNGSVYRVKDTNKNLYVLEHPEVGITDEFSSFGQGVPEGVEKVLNISDLNWHTQHLPHYLLSDTDGEVARQFNEIVDVKVIDSSIANVARLLRMNKTNLDTEKEHREEIKEKLKEFEYLKEMEEEVKECEGLQKEITKLAGEMIDIADLTQEYKAQQRELKEADKVLEMKKDLGEIVLEHEGLVELNKEVDGLLELLNEYWSKEGSVKGYRDVIEEARERFNKWMPNVCPLCDGTGGKKKK